MSSITLQTKTGPEEYEVSDLEEVLVENGKWNKSGWLHGRGLGSNSENDLETCRIKRAEIVSEILEQQASAKA